ncbi:hypothetical protein SeMB42_g00684 [Synchytrium endobioticum]|uniref:Conserved oligomeric Golgi complex subunit 5 n=1 Tax=Synchytrium endobioticum TaxID=286115 RepID=A0A507D9Y5_9FUNG|nr:hypothetical protein SeLEV6574_g02151 [Synchytrium endobioticum]TPX53590.1 hypothetical protein SeMB42_g00684 [Synchytrium endobioticum]
MKNLAEEAAIRIPSVRLPEKNRDHQRHLTQWQKYRNHFGSGAIALSASFAAMHFLDTYKIIVQNSAGKGTISNIKFNVFRAGPQGGLRLATYEWTKAHLLHQPSSSSKSNKKQSWHPTFGPVMASAISAISGDTVSSIVKVPREVITTRLQTEAASSTAKPSFFKAVSAVYTQEGITGFFRGVSSTTARDWPFMIILFTSYESFKKVHEHIMSNGISDEDYDEEIAITTLRSTLFGGVSGALAGYLTTPFDVIKTKIMTASPRRTSRRTMVSVTRELIDSQRTVLAAAGERPAGFKTYKAFWTGAVARSTWWFGICSIFFPVYETMKETFRDLLNSAFLGTTSEGQVGRPWLGSCYSRAFTGWRRRRGSSIPLNVLSDPEYAPFTLPDFDPSDFASRVLKAPTGSPYHGMDVSSALSKLTFSIDFLDKHLREQISTHYEDLLQKVTNLHDLGNVAARVKESVDGVFVSLERIKTRIKDPYDQIRDRTMQLERIQAAAEMLRKVIRFLYLIKRLNSQLPSATAESAATSGAELAKAASSLNELDVLLGESDLSAIEIVTREIGFINGSRNQVIQSAESLLQDGLSSQDMTIVSDSVQVFRNLGILSQQMTKTVYGLLEACVVAIRGSLDVGSLNRDVLKDSSPSPTPGGTPVRRVHDVPITQQSAALWSGKLWERMEKLMDVLYSHCIKVYLMDRVLSKKRDAVSHVLFIEEVVKEMDGNIVKYFWHQFSTLLDKEMRMAMKGSPYLQQSLQLGYPRLLRLFQDFFARINMTCGIESSIFSSTQAIKTLSSFESAYMQRSLARMIEPINLALPDRGAIAPGPRQPPSKDDVDKLVRIISRELEVVKFDKALLLLIARNASKAINTYTVRCENLAVADMTAYQIVGSGVAPPAQVLNLEIINSLYHLHGNAWKIFQEFDEAVQDIVEEPLDAIHKLMLAMIEPLLVTSTRDIESVMIKMHKEDYGKPAPIKSSRPANDISTSQYVYELTSRLRWLQREIYARLHCGEETKEWVRLVVSRALEYFIRHGSLVRPLSELGKLKLTKDMAQVELDLDQFLMRFGMKLESEAGDIYRALRAFRSLIFLELSEILANTPGDSPLPIHVSAHYLFVHSHPALPLPMTAFNWSESQYSDWIDAHSDTDVCILLSRCLDAYADEVKRKGEREYCVEYPIVRSLIDRALVDHPSVEK